MPDRAAVPPEDLAVLDDATALFARALTGPLDGDCAACPGWSRKDCANHVLGGGLRYAAYFPRLPEEEVAWTRTADHAGDDPMGALERTSAGLRHELATAPDAEALVPHRLADISVRDLLALRVFELLVHSHDLDPASWEGDEAQTAERLAAWTLDRGRGVIETMRPFGVLGEPPAASADDRHDDRHDARARLLSLAGRPSRLASR